MLPLLDSEYDFVQTVEQYNKLTDPYQYEIIIVRFGGEFVTYVLNDQTNCSKRLKWVHSMTAGIE